MSVRAVCRTAGVTERYFYESFSDRDELVLTVFGQVAAAVFAGVEKAVSGQRSPRAIAAATVDAVVGLPLDEPAKGRVLFISNLIYTRFSEIANYPSGAAISVVLFFLAMLIVYAMTYLVNRGWQQ